eukprot:g16649.t1
MRALCRTVAASGGASVGCGRAWSLLASRRCSRTGSLTVRRAAAGSWARRLSTAPPSSRRVAPVRCMGCGARLQQDDKTQPGFIESSVVEAFVAGKPTRPTKPPEVLDPFLLNPEEGLQSRPVREQMEKQYAGEHVEPIYAFQQEAKPRTTLRCQRCFKLSNYGFDKGAVNVVPQTSFSEFLVGRFGRPEGGRSAVILKLVDVSDLSGSFIENFTTMVGARHPIILIANKADLLPTSVGITRLKFWLKTEAKNHALKFHSVHVISAEKGDGIRQMMRSAVTLANKNPSLGPRDIYLVGCANVGKSTLINKLMKMRLIKRAGELVRPLAEDAQASAGSTAPGEADEAEPAEGDAASVRDQPQEPMTISLVPGTTLDCVKFSLIPAREGSLWDTPGVANFRQLTSQLNYDELRAVLPRGRLIPITYRLRAGQSLLLGGFARIDMVDGQPYFFTSFVNKHVDIHITATEKVMSFLDQHAGSLLTPPFSSERYKELGLSSSPHQDFEYWGKGWFESCGDIVIPGLGWVALTGCDRVTVRVYTAGHMTGTRSIFREDSLLPFEARSSTKAWHGKGKRGRSTFNSQLEKQRIKSKQRKQRQKFSAGYKLLLTLNLLIFMHKAGLHVYNLACGIYRSFAAFLMFWILTAKRRDSDTHECSQLLLEAALHESAVILLIYQLENRIIVTKQPPSVAIVTEPLRLLVEKICSPGPTLLTDTLTERKFKKEMHEKNDFHLQNAELETRFCRPGRAAVTALSKPRLQKVRRSLA